MPLSQEWFERVLSGWFQMFPLLIAWVAAFTDQMFLSSRAVVARMLLLYRSLDPCTESEAQVSVSGIGHL